MSQSFDGRSYFVVLLDGFVDRVLTDDEFREVLENWLTKEMYETLRVGDAAG